MATFSKLRDGSWGVRGQSLAEGQSVNVTRKDGTSVPAVVGKVLWRGNDGTCLATIAEAAPKSSSKGAAKPKARRTNRECQCGACEDLLSFGYKPGQRITCPECGGWAEAW